MMTSAFPALTQHPCFIEVHGIEWHVILYSLYRSCINDSESLPGLLVARPTIFLTLFFKQMVK
jgi:hypothetical protein